MVAIWLDLLQLHCVICIPLWIEEMGRQSHHLFYFKFSMLHSHDLQKSHHMEGFSNRFLSKINVSAFSK